MNEKDSIQKADLLLNRILRADAEARQMTAAASSERDAAALKLSEEKTALRKEYEAETERLLQRVRESVRKSAGSRLQAIETEKNGKLQQLDALSASRTAAWVEQIFAAILRG